MSMSHAILTAMNRLSRTACVSTTLPNLVARQMSWNWIMRVSCSTANQLCQGQMTSSQPSLWGEYRVVMGLVICGVAMLFNRGGKAIVSSILLIIVIDLGCGLMLLTSPMGLDVANLPVFDVLIVSELIAVSLLPAVSVFPIALGNILFISGDIALQPHTPALNQLLASGMAYDVVAQPIGLQIIVAVVTYLLVRSALRAIARADRAEEVAELQRREAERTHQLESGIQQLLRTQVRAANGDLTARANLSQGNILWQVGISLNLLLTRLQKAAWEASRAENENQHLRWEVARLTEALREVGAGNYHT
jgi:hypothetical protein